MEPYPDIKFNSSVFYSMGSTLDGVVIANGGILLTDL